MPASPHNEEPAGGVYDRKRHGAARTGDYVFSQLIPYIGNKRRLLGLVGEAVDAAGPAPGAAVADLFSGSGVVSRWLKRRGFRVFSNDWEPYTEPINTCHVACNHAPAFARLGGYGAALDALNSLPPREDWVARNLCPRNDETFDDTAERMFYMRKNGMRIDAIRGQIAAWREEGLLAPEEEACLLAPLLYQACYTSNTSGVFKGFHRGWGGQTGTALYRIASDLRLSPAVFHDNGLENRVSRLDAVDAARALPRDTVLAYVDPPYNQHPYASNYHVLNSITLWDKPALPPATLRGGRAAIRRDWRDERRSAYNHRGDAAAAYTRLLDALPCRHILTSYSTDGMIPLADLLAANTARGSVRVFMRGYKRYRVSSQRFSEKPMNVEFVLVLDTLRPPDTGVEQLLSAVLGKEAQVLMSHPGGRDGAG